ncbi:alkaline phosphatase [Sporolactobacillus sp. THM7-4]|nr:alkaline phosphatase [Sporolactobacillus sp. THM7-4]
MFSQIVLLMNHYGYLVLFLSVMIELIIFILPIPAEILMTYTGFLVYQGQLGWVTAISVAWIGSMIGMTLSYGIGYKLGAPFFYKYGSKVYLSRERIEKISRWFNKHGNKLLMIAYFIPGVRHITGYSSGITRIHYRSFAVFAYIGALIWVSTFISLGKTLGPQWEQFHATIQKYLILGVTGLTVILATYYLFKKNRSRIYHFLIATLKKVILTFDLLGKARFFVIATLAVFILLFGLMVGMIQDYLANETRDFNQVAILLVHLIFGREWNPLMRDFSALASDQVLIILVGFSALWILLKGHHKRLELITLLSVAAGGLALEEGLQYLFGLIGAEKPFLGSFSNAFPGEKSLLTVTIYGYSGFLLVRYYGTVWSRFICVVTILFICLLVMLSRIYYGLQLPNDIIAGFVFGGVWLTLNIILFEIFCMLQRQTARQE